LIARSFGHMEDPSLVRSGRVCTAGGAVLSMLLPRTGVSEESLTES